MNKKYKITLAILLICVSIFSLFKFTKLFDINPGLNITITNNTDVPVSNLALSYKVGGTIQMISTINPKESFKCKVDTNSFKGENSITLRYKDKSNKQCEETIIGYLESGYTGNANVIINNVDESGVLLLEVKE